MATFTGICGFECGISGTGTHWSTPTLVTMTADSEARTGLRSAVCNVTASQPQMYSTASNAATIQVVRVFVKFDAFPDATCFIVWTNATQARRLGLAYHAASQQLRCGTGALSLAASGIGVELDTWYCLDVKMDNTGGAKTADAQVNGVVCTQATSVDAGGAGAVGIGGIGVNVTGNWRFDDFAVSSTSGDYPIGFGCVVPLIPTHDGTHNLIQANKFESGGTGTDLTNATTDAFELINELPMDTSTPTTNDSIRIASEPYRSEYVEVGFGPPADSTPLSAPPRAIAILMGFHLQTPGSFLAAIRVYLADNGLVKKVLTGTGTLSTVEFIGAIVSTPPSGATGWTITGYGDIRNVTARIHCWGSTGDYHVDGLLIEAEIAQDFANVVDTFEFDEPEPDAADRVPIDYYLAWQMMDSGAENRNKKIDSVRITGKGSDIEVQIHAASPGDEISKDDIETGTGPRHTVTLPDTTVVTRYEQEKVKVKNLSIWTARYSGTWDGTGIRDRLDELIISGDTHGTEK